MDHTVYAISQLAIEIASNFEAGVSIIGSYNYASNSGASHTWIVIWFTDYSGLFWWEFSTGEESSMAIAFPEYYLNILFCKRFFLRVARW